MNFDYIVYNGGYDLWRFFLNNGYPISIEVIQDLIIEGGYKVKIENIYKTDYIKLKDKSIQFIEDHQFALELRTSLKTAITEESIAVTPTHKNFFSWRNYVVNWLSFYIVRMMQGVLGYDWHDNIP